MVGLQGGAGGPKWVELTSPVIRLGNGPGQHSRKIVSTASWPQPYIYVFLQTATALCAPEQSDFLRATFGWGRGNFIKWTVKAPARSLGGKTTPIEFGKSSEKHRAKVTLVKGRLSVPEAEFEPRSRTPGGLLVLIVLLWGWRASVGR